MIVGDGRPLRFLALVSGGWVALRIGIVWHATGSLPEAMREILPLPKQAVAAETAARPAMPSISADRAAMQPIRVATAAPSRAAPALVADPTRVQLALLAMTRFAGMMPEPSVGSVDEPRSRPVATLPTLARTTSISRLSVSSWMIARGGTGVGATTLSPQLGGTQGGIRIDYALIRGIAATARIAAPAAGAGRELSLGVAWRPAGVPLRFVAEQRVALDRGRGGTALGVSGGVSELALPGGFRLEGYGQAGAIVRNGIERYVDASVRAARPITELAGLTVDVGGGAWGGAQRGVARLDLGPSVGVRVPLGGRPVRLAVDWRQRVAGNARPGSGPALTLGTDF